MSDTQELAQVIAERSAKRLFYRNGRNPGYDKKYTIARIKEVAREVLKDTAAELERLRGVEESKDDEIARYEEAMQQAAQAVYDELAPGFGEVVAKAGYHAVKTLHREAAEQAKEAADVDDTGTD